MKPLDLKNECGGAGIKEGGDDKEKSVVVGKDEEGKSRNVKNSRSQHLSDETWEMKSRPKN